MTPRFCPPTAPIDIFDNRINQAGNLRFFCMDTSNMRTYNAIGILQVDNRKGKGRVCVNN